jgi:hypothetical protein
MNESRSGRAYTFSFTADLPHDSAAAEAKKMIGELMGVEVEVISPEQRLSIPRPDAFLDRAGALEDYVHQKVAIAVNQAFGGKLPGSTGLPQLGGMSVQNKGEANEWMTLPIWSPILRRVTQREKTFISKTIGRATRRIRHEFDDETDIQFIRWRSVEQIARAYGVSLHGAMFMKDAFRESPQEE